LIGRAPGEALANIARKEYEQGSIQQKLQKEMSLMRWQWKSAIIFI